jgi:hypothetical protein
VLFVDSFRIKLLLVHVGRNALDIQYLCQRVACHKTHPTKKNFIYITNFMGHDLAIIVVQNLLFIGLYGIGIDVIHLLVLFEH